MNSPVLEMLEFTATSLRDVDAVLVADVNWRVAAGDFWCVSGAGGSGKSEFLLLAAGLLAPLRGTLKLFGEELPETEEAQLEQRLKLGFVFDGGNLFNHLTVAENLALPLRYHRELSVSELSERVETLLEFAELTPWANSTPGALGRNWQKRAGLMRAVALQPELLLLDNPLGGADARHAAWWQTTLGQLAAGHWSMPDKRATTLVVTTDDAQLWQNRARQFARLQDGRFEVPTKEVLAAAITKG